jgi:hypothetical protein
VQEIRVARLFHPRYALANLGAPVQFLFSFAAGEVLAAVSIYDDFIYLV